MTQLRNSELCLRLRDEVGCSSASIDSSFGFSAHASTRTYLQSRRSEMDNVTFTRELNKYKVIRLADHTKIRWKTQRKPESKPKLLSAPNASNGKAVLAKEGTDEDFYKLFQRINANALSEKDMARLIVAMKEEHPGMVGSVNLDDLEHLASLLLKV